MPTIEARLRQVSLKVKRAKEHVSNLEAEIRRFMDAKPYGVSVKRQPDTRKLVYYVSSVQPTPECLPLIAGDVIQNLMCALDHLAYQIVCSDTNDTPPNPNWIYFPIQDTPEKYESKKRRKVEGARQETLEAIDALKPYKGGNDLLWMLYRLNNIEKHRLLLTVGSHAAGIHVGHLMANLPGVPAEFSAAMRTMSVFLITADKGFPLKEGYELYIGAVDEEPNLKQEFRFDVALSEPGIIESKSLLETLHQLTTLVEGIVVALTPRLRDTT